MSEIRIRRIDNKQGDILVDGCGNFRGDWGWYSYCDGVSVFYSARYYEPVPAPPPPQTANVTGECWIDKTEDGDIVIYHPDFNGPLAWSHHDAPGQGFSFDLVEQYNLSAEMISWIERDLSKHYTLVGRERLEQFRQARQKTLIVTRVKEGKS